ncbi:MAG: phosphate starvation-inducible protein PhoH [Omnitrophica WOR_2 bacterium SM23_72]|nr:MAG: phosphate starvation-inducible protein PhoH [Omnitrophica WOR_2 bacterium SM23_72]
MEKVIKLETLQETRNLFGLHDENLKTLEKEFKVKLHARGEHLKVSGTATNIKKASGLIEYILDAYRNSQTDLGRKDLAYLISDFKKSGKENAKALANSQSIMRSSSGKQVGPRTKGQREYVEAIKRFDIVFGIGPAGTGKTYLAMACAVEALKKQEVRRIILTRPAIEAGESLGFLPGDMYEKISPYLRPLYDALYDMMEAERIEKHLETGIIEVAPLAYMRGRTLNDAFIILDEAQNCTAEQMKMFLTRLGFDSKAVITGDITQSDLPDGKPIGLLQAQDILKSIEGIHFIYFTGSDVVRHALVQRIIEAYDKNNR